MNRDQLLPFRVRIIEKRKIEERAAELELTVSEYLRTLIKADIPELDPVTKITKRQKPNDQGA